MDLAVGVADHGAQLAQRGLEVGAAALELLDVRERLGVLVLRERVDGPELLAPALQALDARDQRLLLLGVERLGVLRDVRLGQLEALGDGAQLERRPRRPGRAGAARRPRRS